MTYTSRQQPSADAGKCRKIILLFMAIWNLSSAEFSGVYECDAEMSMQYIDQNVDAHVEQLKAKVPELEVDEQQREKIAEMFVAGLQDGRFEVTRTRLVTWAFGYQRKEAELTITSDEADALEATVQREGSSPYSFTLEALEDGRFLATIGGMKQVWVKVPANQALDTGEAEGVNP